MTGVDPMMELLLPQMARKAVSLPCIAVRSGRTEPEPQPHGERGPGLLHSQHPLTLTGVLLLRWLLCELEIMLLPQRLL